MIVIIRMLTDDAGRNLWNEITTRKDDLQKVLQNRGRLLYLSKRKGHNEASLFVHAKDSTVINELISNYLNKIESVSAIWLIHLYKPRFFPLPADTTNMKRFTITAKVKPKYLSEVYGKLADPNLPEGLKKVYYAFTFHLYDETLQYSLLADSEQTLQKYLTEKVNKIEGVLRTDIHPIEKTKPFISYKEWQEYAGSDSTIPTWQHHMISQFEE
ncbi:MAG: hypothetical protein HZA49_08005 [Planctomycetes bacterium]|nr:hypothetical protein [Planctomycetota bacterium]